MEGEIQFGSKNSPISFIAILAFCAFPWLIPILPGQNGAIDGFSIRSIVWCSIGSMTFIGIFGQLLLREHKLRDLRLAWTPDALAMYRRGVNDWTINWTDYRGCRQNKRGGIDLLGKDRQTIATLESFLFLKQNLRHRGRVLAILKLRTPGGGVFDTRPRSKPWNPLVTRSVILVSAFICFAAFPSIRADWLMIQAVNRGEDVGYQPGTPFINAWAWGSGSLALVALIVGAMAYGSERAARAFREIGAFSRIEDPPTLAEYFLAGSASPYWLEQVQFRYMDPLIAIRLIRKTAKETVGLLWFFACCFLLFLLVPLNPPNPGKEPPEPRFIIGIAVFGFCVFALSAILALRRSRTTEAELNSGIDDILIAKEDRLSLLREGSEIPIEIVASKPRIAPFSRLDTLAIEVTVDGQRRQYRSPLMKMDFN